MADIDVSDGALEEGLQAILHGTPEEALQAAKTLGSSASSNVYTQCLEQEGLLRALLKVRSTPVSMVLMCFDF